MIYLTLLHSLEVFFPSCCAVSTFSATPCMPSGTMVRGKVTSSEMTDVTDHVSIKNLRPTSFCFITGGGGGGTLWTVGCVGKNMDILLVLIIHSDQALFECWCYHQEVICLLLFCFFSCQRFFGVTVASHNNLQHQARCKTLSVPREV